MGAPMRLNNIVKSILITGILVTTISVFPSVPPEASPGSVTSGTQIVSMARRYLGTPYRYGGGSPAGFDCSGLTQYVYNEAGIKLPRSAKDQFEMLKPIRVPRPGDLIFFKLDGNSVSHVGIYVGRFKFIHAPSSGKRVSYADIRNKYWESHYAGSRSVLP